MIRKALILFSIVGLLLGIALWVVSYGWWVFYYGTRGTYAWAIGPGMVAISFYNPQEFWSGPKKIPRDGVQFVQYNDIPIGKEQWLPIISNNSKELNIRVPLWVPNTVMALLLWWSIKPLYLRRKRLRTGCQCLSCGYNLSGAVSSFCTECGTPFTRDAADTDSGAQA